MKIDPKNATTYQVNAKKYIAELYELHREFLAAAAHFKTREFIGFHSAYDYLAHRYGLKQIASIEELPGAGVSTSQAMKIVRLIREHRIQYLAMETGLTGQGANLIITETGVKTITLQPLETYDDLKDTYQSLMRKNLAALKTALGYEEPPAAAPAQ